MLRQIEFALFDMHVHFDYKPNGNRTVLQLMNEIRNEVAVIIPPDFNRFPNSFAHIFAGGYAAGYYSYKWAEVLDADAFAYFQEKGIFNKEVATKFKDNVLSKGGTDHPMTLYKQFRGQEPKPDALLKRAGLI